MSKVVISDISWHHAKFSGNVESISVERHTVLDNDDLQSLESKINTLQDKVDKLERQNELMVKIFKESLLKSEEDNSELVNSIINISQNTRNKILSILLNPKREKFWSITNSMLKQIFKKKTDS